MADRKDSPELDPRYCRAVAALMESPYFDDHGKDHADRAAHIAAVKAKRAEREAFRDACLEAGSFAVLPDQVRDTWHKAETSYRDAEVEEEYADHGRDFSYEISPEAAAAAGPSADEAQALTLAMIAAAATGHHDQVQEISVLGRTPGLTAEISRAHQAAQGPASQAQRPTRPTRPPQPANKSIGPSPFHKRLSRRDKKRRGGR
jgi:hypothetical protein